MSSYVHQWVIVKSLWLVVCSVKWRNFVRVGNSSFCMMYHTLALETASAKEGGCSKSYGA